MIETLAPPIRKSLAVGLLLLALLLLVSAIILPIIEQMAASRERLADARFRRARLEAVAARPEPVLGDPVALGLYLEARNRAAAEPMLAVLLTAAAQRNQVTLERAVGTPADPVHPAILSVDLVATAPETALVAFVGDLEGGQPLVRLTTWRIAAPDAAGGTARLEARASAVWGALQ